MILNQSKPSLQYAFFCSDFIESKDQISAVGILDWVDVRCTIKSTEVIPEKIFPLKMVLGINGPPGTYTLKLVISRPSGGVSATVDLEQFNILPDEYLNRCIANLDMEVSEDGLYKFNVLVNNMSIGSAMLQMSFLIEFEY